MNQSMADPSKPLSNGSWSSNISASHHSDDRVVSVGQDNSFHDIASDAAKGISKGDLGHVSDIAPNDSKAIPKDSKAVGFANASGIAPG